MLMNMCQQITGAALSAYLPTLLAENGFEGATAQIATLAPYGCAAVVSRSYLNLMNQTTNNRPVYDHRREGV
jgi:hypothetical protein